MRVRFIVSILIFASVLPCAGLAEPPQTAERAAYDNDAVFEQMSGAARTRAELKFGRKKTRSAPSTGGERSGAGTTSPFSTSVALALVNDPTADATTQDTQSETALVLGSGANVVSAFNDSGSFLGGASKFTGFSQSTNGGTNWTDKGALPTNPDGDAGDPVLARSAQTGTIFLSTLSFTAANLDIFRSTDNGATFTGPINGSPGLPSGSQDKEWIAVDNFAGTGFGNVYMFWRNFGTPSGMTFTKSTNDGLAWFPSGGTLLASGAGQGAQVVVGLDHSVYAFWYESSVTPRRIAFRKSTDLGVSFGALTTNVTTFIGTGVNGDLGLGGFRSSSFPQVVVNPVSGNLYIVYPDLTGGPDKGNIFFRQSTDGGTNWGAAVPLNDDGTTRAQWQPAIAVRPDGTALSVCWYDRRNDPADALIERWGVTATISGSTVTFGPNFSLSPQFPAVFGVDPVVNATYMGDYDQMAADNSFFYTTWGDNRDQSIAAPARKNANVRFAQFQIVLPDDLKVSPSTGLSSSGGTGGPFTPACATYTLTNSGTASFTWFATHAQVWVDVTPSTSTLGVGAKTNVDVCINTGANALGAGAYSDTVTFSNAASGLTQTRAVTLSVLPPTIFLADFEDGSGGYSADGFTYTADPDATSNLWHGSTRRSVSPTHSQYYGLEIPGNYDTGARNAGNLLSPSISLAGVTAPIALSFKYLLQTENLSPFDAATVEISTNAGSSWITLATLANSSTFTTSSTDISAHAGKNILVRFNFDTIDAILNAFEGWYVDDVQVLGVLLNALPVVSSAQVLPETNAFSDESLVVANVVTNDAEFEAITLAYQWQFTTNGTVFVDQGGATTSTLAAAPGNSGKLWRCRLTPSDPSGTGTNYFAGLVSVNNRPNMLGRHNQFYSYDSDLFLAGGGSSFTRDAIINEFSQGNGGSKEWVEILFLKDSNASGWRLFDVSGSTGTITFQSTAFWSNVTAGTLLVVYNANDRDTNTVLAADDTDPSDGKLVIPHNNATYFSSTAWISLLNTGDSIILSNPASSLLLDGISYSTGSGQTPVIANVDANHSASYTNNTEAGVDVGANWRIISAAAGFATPTVGNGTVNSNWIAQIRSGAFSNPQFRFGASGDTVPGLAIDANSGVASGTINAPGGGFYNVVIERFVGINLASQQYNLLVGDSNDVYRIPAGKTWAINSNYTIPGTLVVSGKVDTVGHALVVSNTLDVAAGTVSNATGLIRYHKLVGGPLPGVSEQFNSLPVITSAPISPASPGDADDLTVNVTASDADNDPITYAYQWQDSSDNSLFGDIAFTAGTLPNAATTVGRYYRTVITPNDGIANGGPFTNASVSVQVASELRILSIELSGTNVLINYNTDGGVTNELQMKIYLTEINWTGILTNTPVSTGPDQFIDVGAASQTNRFYRVHQLP